MGLITDFIEFKARSGKGIYAQPQQQANQLDEDIFKAYIPDFLYKPPYGYPRKENLSLLKSLAKNPYVFSVIKTLCDEAASVPWNIKVKPEFAEAASTTPKPEGDAEDADGEDAPENPVEKKAKGTLTVPKRASAEPYKDKINEVKKFFNNPNDNDESWEHIMRCLIVGLAECDAGVLVKVFNQKGKMKQMLARDGATFLKNPSIYGMTGDKDDFVPPMPTMMHSMSDIFLNGNNTTPQKMDLVNQYDAAYRYRAAYFQYGWTAGSMPVPFGKREIVYMMQNPRPDSIYGRSPIEILATIILTLQYGSEFNLDFYTNNNMPEGVIMLKGGKQEHVDQFNAGWEKKFRFQDSLGKWRKRFFKFPIVTTEVGFVPFQLNPQQMDIIAQQQWFSKLLWMCFGVTADEMGFTEDSTKNNGENQSSISRRKAIKPLLDVIAYHVSTQIIPEFFSDDNGVCPDPADVPLYFEFDNYDYDQDKKKHDLLEQEMRMGVKTAEMVAEELQIDLAKLEAGKAKEEAKQKEQMQFVNDALGGGNKKNEAPAPFEKKSSVPGKVERQTDKLASQVDAHIDDIKKDVLKLVEDIPDGTS